MNEPGPPSSSTYAELDGQSPYRRNTSPVATAAALGLHALVFALLVFGLPTRHSAPGPDIQRPIVISLVVPDPVIEPTPEASPVPPVAPALETAATVPAPPPASPAPAAPVVSDALPYDSSFDAFAHDSTSSSAAAVTSSAAALPPPPPPGPPPSAVPRSGPDSAATGPATGALEEAAGGPEASGDACSEGSGSDPGESSGRNYASSVQAGLDSSALHNRRPPPAYIKLCLQSTLDAVYDPQLHRFLLRLINCGVRPLFVRNPRLFAEAEVSFAPGGSVVSAKLLNARQFEGDPDYGTVSDRLMRALSNPDCAYFQLPPATYPSWRDIRVTFYQLQ